MVGRLSSVRGSQTRRVGRSNPACRENEQPYWAANPLHGSQNSAPWVSKFCSMGLKNPLRGSQKSAPRVSKFCSTGLKNPPEAGKPRARPGPGDEPAHPTRHRQNGFSINQMNLCAAYYSIFCGFRVTSEGLRRKLFFLRGGFRGGFFDIIYYILRGGRRGAGS